MAQVSHMVPEPVSSAVMGACGPVELGESNEGTLRDWISVGAPHCAHDQNRPGGGGAPLLPPAPGLSTSGARVKDAPPLLWVAPLSQAHPQEEGLSVVY